jgi:hypothetical protein
MASTQTGIAHDRTGAATSPKLTQEMIAGAQELCAPCSSMGIVDVYLAQPFPIMGAP